MGIDTAIACRTGAAFLLSGGSWRFRRNKTAQERGIDPDDKFVIFLFQELLFELVVEGEPVLLLKKQRLVGAFRH